MIVPLALVLSLAAPRDPWFGADKLKHFFVAAFVQSAAYNAARLTRADHGTSLGIAWSVTGVVSVGKELYDRRHTKLFSVRDLSWDALGAGAAVALVSRGQRAPRRP